MANRNKNSNKYTPNIARGRRPKGSFALRTLQSLAISARINNLSPRGGTVNPYRKGA